MDKFISFKLSHMVLARGQKEHTTLWQLSCLFIIIFHEYFANFDGNFGVFDDTQNWF